MNYTFSFEKGTKYLSNRLKMKYLKKYGFKELEYNPKIQTGWCNNNNNSILTTCLYKEDPLYNKLKLFKLLKNEYYIPETSSIKNGMWTSKILTEHGFYYVKDPIEDAGRGIVFKTNKEDIEEYSKQHSKKEFIIQKRIEEPFCHEGRKLDLRVYCVICSNKKNMWVRIYKNAICRKNPYKYDINNSNTELTNTTVNKKNIDYESCVLYLTKDNQLYDFLMPKIVKIIYKLFKKYAHIYEKFKSKPIALLYGLDFLVTKSQKCYLLEINRLPSIRNTDFHNTVIETLVKSCYKPLLLKNKLFKSSLYYDIKIS